MPNISLRTNIISLWISWYFKKMPSEISKGWKNLLAFNLEYFSIPLLFRTLFTPWRRTAWEYPRGFDIKIYLENFISNIFSRFLGALMRLFLILGGIISEILIFFLGAIIILSWLFLPVLLVIGFIVGLRLLVYF